MNLAHHPFVVCMACQSGLQDIGPGDEPLGLLTALFCAGASSVIGTFWPVQSDTARDFAEIFHRHIVSMLKIDHNQTLVLNVAQAIQTAVLELKSVRPDPYS